MSAFAVVDVETTGFTGTDRIVEIAIVQVEGGEIVREWETLVNPNRDISNSDIHGISADIVSLAPMFDEIADEVSFLLNNRILVAHNISFDARMIKQEYQRINKVIDLGSGFCTLQQTRMRLSGACEAYGVENSSAHRALADARATAEILIQLPVYTGDLIPITSHIELQGTPARILTRDAFQPFNDFSPRKRIIPDFNSTGFAGAQLSYLDALATVMSDLVITLEEAEYLRQWAEVLGLSDEERNTVNNQYLDLLLSAARRDGFISSSELNLIKRTCESLGLPEPALEMVQVTQTELLFSGARVCFTGEYRNQQGIVVDRKVLEDIAKSSALAPVGNVSKKYCDLVIAADKSSMSGKAKKARDYAIPVISVEEFLDWTQSKL